MQKYTCTQKKLSHGPDTRHMHSVCVDAQISKNSEQKNILLTSSSKKNVNFSKLCNDHLQLYVPILGGSRSLLRYRYFSAYIPNSHYAISVVTDLLVRWFSETAKLALQTCTKRAPLEQDLVNWETM